MRGRVKQGMHRRKEEESEKERKEEGGREIGKNRKNDEERGLEGER